MVSEGTLALLSACGSLLNGRKLAIARDQIRMTLGCLKVLGGVWPRTARNVREIQTIAQCVLGIGLASGNGGDMSRLNELPPLGASGINLPTDDTTLSASVRAIEDSCGWYNLGDLDDDVSWGMSNELYTI